VADDKLFSSLDLAALMVSRVCHDIIGPVGAVANGLEILEEEDDSETRGMAMDLVASSIEQASAKLQFARLAFGASGSSGTVIDLGDARKVVEGLIGRQGKVQLHWAAPSGTAPKDQVRLLLNLVQMALEAIPRGGDLSVAFGGTVDEPRLFVEVSGNNLKVIEGLADRLRGENTEELDARSVQSLLAALLARRLGLVIELMRGEGGGKVIFSAEPQLAKSA
jgi:histidine phosphotransferase ChpT